MFVAKPTELHWQFPWATPKYTIRKMVYRREQLKARVEFLYVKESSWFYLSASILFSQFLLQHMSRSRSNAPKCRPCRLRTFLSYTCLPLHLWLAVICSKYEIVFNMSESLLFISKEVIGSQHRKFTIIFQSLILRFCGRWVNNKLKYIEHYFVTWAPQKVSQNLRCKQVQERKDSVCTVCTYTAWSACWRDRFAVFERDMFCKRNWLSKVDASK